MPKFTFRNAVGGLAEVTAADETSARAAAMAALYGTVPQVWGTPYKRPQTEQTVGPAYIDAWHGDGLTLVT